MNNQPTWLTETLVELLDAYEACGGQLPHFKSALLVIEEYSDVDGRHIFDQDNKGWKAVSNAIKGRVIPDDDQYIGCQQGGTGYRLPPARSAPDFGVYPPYPQRKRALFHAPAAQAD